MIQLRVLSGRRAGAEFRGAQFPIRVGRAPDSHLILEEPGVWPRHFLLFWQGETIRIEADPEALLEVNGAPVRESVLRNGDTIMAGGVSLRFNLAAVRQSSLTLREALTWAALVLLCAAQVALAWALPR